MSLKIGAKIENIKLPNIDGSAFDLESLKGKKVLISFHRFATCPFCNLHIHQLTTNFSSFSDGLTVVAIFDSPIIHLAKHTGGHLAPFAILADENNTYYQRFDIERSILKTLKGFIKHFHTVFYAMFINGYWPFPIKGNVFTMPLEILIDETGTIQHIHKGKDEGDHLTIEELKHYSIFNTVPKRF